AIHDVESLWINIEHGQCGAGGGGIDAAVGLDLGVVAYAAQQAVGDTGRAARAPGDFGGAVGRDGDVEKVCAARHDTAQVFGAVELEARHDAEPVAQRVGEHPGPGRGADQRERLQIDLDAAGRGTFADQDVDLKVF